MTGYLFIVLKRPKKFLASISSTTGSFRQKKGSSAYQFTVVADGDLGDGLELVDGVDDDRGVAIPGQVHSVCRRTL